MVWNMNFCAPFIPNDETINFHRYLQTSQVLFLLALYIIVHIYYKFIKKTPDQGKSGKQKEKIDRQSSNGSQQHSSNQQDMENSSQSEESDHQKSVSIDIEKRSDDQNDSYISFKSSELKETRATKKDKMNLKQTPPTPEDVTIQQVQNFFPIVVGHHLVIMGASIMYSPYAQQSIAAILYSVFIIFLIIFNARRFTKTTYIFWGLMCALNVFIMMSALLEVGQSNYDYMRYKCFSEEYVSLY